MLWKTDAAISGQINVLLLATSETPLSALAAAPRAQFPMIRLEVLQMDPSAFAGSMTNHEYNVLVVEIDPGNPIHVGELAQLMMQATKPVVVVSARFDPDFMRSMLRLQVADWLPADASAEALSAACQRVAGLAAGQPKTSATKQRVLAFTPVLGGLGATTLAIQAGLHFARKKREAKACLIDLDFASGECTDYLDIPANLQLDELIGEPERLDHHMLEIMLSQHRSGLCVLASRSEIGSYEKPEAGVVARLLDLAAARFDTLILDLPRHWHAWSDNVLLGCTDVFFVCDPSIPALRAAKRALMQVEKHFTGAIHARLIVNKFQRSLFSFGVAERDIRNMFGQSLAGFVCDAPEAMREAINRGIPPDEVAGGKRVSRDVAGILEKEPAHDGA